MPQENLKRCPFCGDKGYDVTHEYQNPHSLRYGIECDCGARGPQEPTLEAAIKAWNTRAPQSQSGDRAKALVDIEQMIEDGAHTSTEIMDKVAALIQPEFEVVDVDSVDGVVDKSAIRYIIQQGYMIIRKKGRL